jgi:MFS family permease
VQDSNISKNPGNLDQKNNSYLTPVAASFIGWLMDGYVSIGFVLVAITLSNLLFPPSYHEYALLSIFLILPLGAYARIIGSTALGNFIGDRYGRKTLLVYSIIGFSTFSFLIAFIPVYSQVGWFSPVIYYILTVFVGIFAGAEYSGGAAMSMENVPQEKRVLVGSFVQSGYGAGYFVVAIVLGTLQGPLNISPDWAWRYMYLTAIIPGIIALILRMLIKETDIFQKIEKEGKLERVPIFGVLKQYRDFLPVLVLICGLLFVNAMTFNYFYFILADVYSISPSVGDFYIAIINLVSLFGVWFGGFAGLKIFKRTSHLTLFSLLFAVILIPSFVLVQISGINALIAFCMIAFFEATIFASIPAFLAETFSKTHRTSGIGAIYNLGSLPASFGLAIITAILLFNNHFLMVWELLVLLGLVVMLAGVFTSRETYSRGYDRINN